jgi:hypothetical protein
MSLSSRILIDKLILLLIFSITILIYYYVGPSNFPDYNNYIEIATGIGFEDARIAEWIPYAWFSIVNSLTSSPKLSVDLWVAMLHVFVFFLILKNKDGGESNAFLWILFILGPLLLTTTVRASFAYFLSFLLYISRRDGMIKTLPTSLAMVSFHDSAILILILYFLNSFLTSIKNKLHLLIVSAVTILVAALIGRDYLNDVEKLNQLSVIATYIGTSSSQWSVAKNMYMMVNVGLAIYVIKYCCEDYFIVLLTFAVMAVYLIAPVAGIRLVHYLTMVVIYELSKNNLLIPNRWTARKFGMILILGFPLYLVNYNEVLRHA